MACYIYCLASLVSSSHVRACFQQADNVILEGRERSLLGSFCRCLPVSTDERPAKHARGKLLRSPDLQRPPCSQEA